jgi:hypothetical protein
MFRAGMAGALVTCLVSASLACALPLGRTSSLAEKVPLSLAVRLYQPPVERSTAPAPKGGFVITDETEIKVDGRLCKYSEVPGGAVVVLLEVSADGKTILRVHFRTKK